MRRDTDDVRVIFEQAPSVADEQGFPRASQGEPGKAVFCCHVSVTAKHWVYPTKDGKRLVPVELAFGPLVVNKELSGCDLRPTDPSFGLPKAVCGDHADEKAESFPYYQSADLGKFGEIGQNRKDLADKFFAWYGAVFEPGALSAREKSLIALAVAHAVQCPYCIDAYSKDAHAKGAPRPRNWRSTCSSGC